MQKTCILLSSLIIAYITFFSSCRYDKADLRVDKPYCDTGSVSFSNNVIPIMNAHCSNPPYASCHSWATDYPTLKKLINSGKFQDRVLITKNMPEPNNIENSHPLSAAELQTLECWIYQGAPNN